MATIGADIENKIMLAQRVQLLVDNSVGANVDDKVEVMRAIRFRVAHPEQRNNFGNKRIYSAGSPDIELIFTLHITSDVIDFVRVRGTRSANGVLPKEKYQMKLTANDGTHETITINGMLRDHEYIKDDEAQESPARVECVVRVTDEMEPSS